MTAYKVISSRLYTLKPGDIVTDLDLVELGVSVSKSLAIGAIVEQTKSTKTRSKYDKTVEETE